MYKLGKILGSEIGSFKSETECWKKEIVMPTAFGDGEESGKRSAFLGALFISEKGRTICIWCRDTRELVGPGSAPGEQKANLVCSSKGC